ncbi:hypothetical protein ACO0M4_16105 [Streptomyces sp. RGM 3693]|uniref:hypothetical protein n=1 Tax=Streptomyces sp. RGM 3693 TaxID=3413284 RepID=UPI003D29911C
MTPLVGIVLVPHRAEIALEVRSLAAERAAETAGELAGGGVTVAAAAAAVTGFAPGAPADFLLVDGECLAQAVVDVPHRRMVVRAGQVVARDGVLCQ